MARSITARRKGDDYQSRFAWLHLLKMRTDDYIQSVVYESDEISFVDDIIVQYNPSIKDPDTGELINVDFFQCKKHITEAGSFSINNLLDPSFINNQSSMLSRLYTSFQKLKNQGVSFRLYIVSNWFWHPDDLLAKHISEGRIIESFFIGSKSTKLGKIRHQFIEHLKIDEKELIPFIKVIRFKLGINLNDFQVLMQPLLRLASLKQIDQDTSINIYDDLLWKWFKQNKNVFTKDSFQNLLQEEKLIVTDKVSHSEISIRSFLQYARRPSDTLTSHLDLTDSFADRYLIKEHSWNEEIAKRVNSFWNEELFNGLSKPIHLFFDCHLSISFLVGYLSNPKYGFQIIPISKNPKTGYDILEIPSTFVDYKWECVKSSEISDEVIICISVSSNIKNHFDVFYENSNISQIPIVYLSPGEGIGPNIIRDGNHAWHLAHSLRNLLDVILPATCKKYHLFFSVPAAFAYILGTTIGYKLKNIQLYEHDFDGQKYPNKYYTSISLPIIRSKDNGIEQ